MKLNICPVPQTVKFALSSPRLRTWCLANGVLAVQRGSIVQDRTFNYIKSYSTPSNFDAALIRISISLRHDTFPTNMARGPRSATHQTHSTSRIQPNRIDHRRSRHGPLRFFSMLAGCKSHRDWCAVRWISSSRAASSATHSNIYLYLYCKY